MPLYQAVCDRCVVYTEYRASVSDCMKTPGCPECGDRMVKRILTAPTGVVTGKFEPFKSSVDGTLIRCQKDLREHNLRNGVVNVQDGFPEEKVIAGDFNRVEAKLDPNERKQDIAEAIHKVTQGYRPVIGVQDDD